MRNNFSRNRTVFKDFSFKMPNCGAFGCTNRLSHDKELTFHQIPGEGRNKQLRKMWLTNIRRAGELPKDKSFYICSEHFAEDCYERDFKVTKFLINTLMLFSTGFSNRQKFRQKFCKNNLGTSK